MPDTLDARAKSVIDQVIDLEGSDRIDLLERGCAGDPALRDRVESLLASMEKDDAFLHQPTVNIIPTPRVQVTSESPGGRIGPYTLVELIGEGGFGSVYLAEQSEPVRRRVALKIIKLGMDTRAFVARFEHERQTLALMDHPHIARVLDAGATEIGRPYFVMEWVQGEPITTYSDQHNLDVRQRMALFAQVCRAVQHAHQKGIIHRDLKPSNVLVADADDAPLPKVIDFGIAKAICAPLTDRTRITELNHRIGTPEYMSPEQAEPDSADIDTRSDIYSLGVMLYELLTGTTPFDGRRLRESGYEGMLRILGEEQPPRPSLRLKTLAASSDIRVRTAGGSADTSAASSVIEIAEHRRTKPVLLARMLRGDLDWIVMKCLEKDRSRRYETAAALADDIGRCLSNEAVTACPPSAGYRLRKFMRRNRTGVLAGSMVVLALAGGLGAALYGLGVARDERDSARKEADKANWIASFMEQTLRGVEASVHQGRDTALLRALLDDAAEKIAEGRLKGNPDAEVRLRATIGKAYENIGKYEDAEKMLVPSLELARWLWPAGHSELGDTLTALAITLKKAGRVADSEPLFAEALDIVRRLCKGDDLVVATAINNLGYVRTAQGRLAEGEALYSEALEMSQRLYSGDHPHIAVGLTNVAEIRMRSGRTVEAEPVCVQGLEMCRRLHKGDHPDLALSIRTLARIHHMLGRPAEARPLHEEALAMYQRLYAGEHPDVAAGLFDLASVTDGLGQPRRAEPLYLQALEMYQRLFPGGHPDVAYSLLKVSGGHRSSHRLSEADSMAVAALEMYRRLYRRDHPDVAEGLNNLGQVRMAQGRAADAEQLFLEALEIRQRLYPGDHPKTAVSLNNVAYARMMSGRAAEAVSMVEQVLAMRRRLYPGDHPEVATALNNLGGAHIQLGQPSQAEPLYEEALAMERRLIRGDHPNVAQRLANLANARELQGRFADAELLYEEALAMRSRLDFGDHPLHATNLANLAMVRAALGRLAEAEPLLVRSLEMRRRIHKRDHADIANSLAHLASVYQRLSRLDEAETLARDHMAMQERMFPPGHAERTGAAVALATVLADHTWTHRAEARQVVAGGNEQHADRAAEAVTLLREAIEWRTKRRPAVDWWLANARNLLGNALAAVVACDPSLSREQRDEQLKEAEVLLLTGYESLVADAAKVPVQHRKDHIDRAAMRLVRLYELWDEISPGSGKSELAVKWRARASPESATAQRP